MNKVEKYDPDKLVKNPFAFTLKIPVTMKEARDWIQKDGTWVHGTFPAERIPSVRVYNPPGMKAIIAGMSERSKTMLFYIFLEVEPGKDFFQLNPENYMAKNKVRSVNTFKAAKAELIEKNFILPTMYKTVFWINPNYFFPGSRIHKYPECVEPVTEKTN